MKIIFIYIVLISIIALNSCSINDPITNNSGPEIINLVNNELSVGDTLKVEGKNFGTKSPLSYLLFDSTKVFSSDCFKWQDNEIWLILPDTATSGNLSVVSKSDTSNIKEIKINPLPTISSVLIAASNFYMGSLTGNIDERPVKKISITKSFLMTSTEITQKLYRIVMRYNPATEIGDNLPVNNIKWIEAIYFCNKLSKMQNLDTAYRISGADVLWDTNSIGWRLPTEAEWEMSCRAGTSGDFYNDNLNTIAWYSDNSGFRIKPVASKMPNQFGLYDMSGNVWEWCYDYYDAKYYENRPTENPKGPNNGKIGVIRGGAFDQGTYFARSSNRTRPDDVHNNIGFRVVRNLDK